MSLIDKEISDKIFLAELKNEFLNTVKNSIKGIRELNEVKDYNGMRKIAHNLKGISGVFGFQKGSDLAKNIQIAIDKKKFNKADLKISELINYFQNSVIPELEKKENEDE